MTNKAYYVQKKSEWEYKVRVKPKVIRDKLSYKSAHGNLDKSAREMCTFARRKKRL